MSNEQLSENKKLNIGLVAVILIGLGVVAALQFGGGPKPPDTAVEPPALIEKFPEDLVKKLVGKGISYVSILGNEGEINQVLTLYSDGSCEACNEIPLLSSEKIGFYDWESWGVMDIVATPAAAAPGCPMDDCYCGDPKGRCRSVSSRCCKCT